MFRRSRAPSQWRSSQGQGAGSGHGARCGFARLGGCTLSHYSHAGLISHTPTCRCKSKRSVAHSKLPQQVQGWMCTAVPCQGGPVDASGASQRLKMTQLEEVATSMATSMDKGEASRVVEHCMNTTVSRVLDDASEDLAGIKFQQCLRAAKDSKLCLLACKQPLVLTPNNSNTKECGW